MESFSDRIKSLLNKYDLNVNQLTKKIGYTNNTVIGKIINDPKRKPSYDTLHAILEAFPEINRGWLVMGEGTMTGLGIKKGIKYFPGTLTPGIIKGEPQSYLLITGFEDCSIAVTMQDASMEPTFHRGDILLCKNTDPDLLIYGQAYLIFVKNMLMVRYVTECEKDEDFICLKAENKNHGKLRFEKSIISSLYLVRGKVSRL